LASYDFFKVPVVSDTSVNNSTTGTPFTNGAYKIANGHYAATDDGTVYIARVGDRLYFVCIGYGYKGYLWITGTNSTAEWEVTSTQWSSIYDVGSVTIASADWILPMTSFSTEDAMLEKFYDTIVFPDSGGGGSGSSTITVTLTPSLGGGTITVTASSDTRDSNNQGGTSGTGGGNGTFDDTSDKIPISAMPTFSAANSGMITLFRPTLSELRQLGNYLWTNITDFIENLQKLFSNPMDYFIAFNIVPCVPETGTPREIKLGLWNSGVSMAPVKSQWYESDFETIQISPYWGSALDYSPYTKINLFLPFIGSVPLNTDEVMGQTLGLKYRFDLLSGQCVAIVTVNGDCLYQFTGESAVSIPLTGADWSRIYAAAVGATTAVVAGVAGVAGAGAAGAGLTGQTAAGVAESVAAAGTAYADVNATSRGVKGVTAMRAALVEAAQNANNASAQIASSHVRRSSALKAAAITHAVDNVAGNIMGSKVNISHASTISGSAGILGIRRPYVLIEYPNQSLPENYKHFVGYPSNIYAKLNTLSGYTECESVIVSGINATEEEIAEISEALKAGVYL